MEIYLFRHGETDYNRKRIIQGSGVNSSLNEMGRSQAQAFYKKYGHLEFDKVLTSKLKRTHETAQYFIEKNIPWEQHGEINEMNWGIHEGQPGNAAMKVHYREMLEEWSKGNYDARLEEGESAAELASRIQSFINHLKERTEKRLLICSHGRAIRCLVTLMKGNPLTEMENVKHGNTGLYHIKLNNGKFSFLKENDLAHLEK